MATSDSPRSNRPTLSRNNLTSGSFLEDHQQYKSQSQVAPPGSVSLSSIDGMLEKPLDDGKSTSFPILPRKPQSPVAIPPSPSLGVRDSGIVYSMSHSECVRSLADPPQLVATLFYDFTNPRHPHIHSDQLSLLEKPKLPPPTIASGSAPTTTFSNYPLEPPPPEPEPLDHLYGSYISQMCLTHFLYTMDSLMAHNPPETRRLTSSHRCLTPSPTQPRVMEIIFSPPPNPEYLPLPDLRKHESLSLFEREWNVELILQKHSIHRTHKRLVIFDMDSTLIAEETIEQLAAALGPDVQKKVAEITNRAMNGELDFKESLRERVKLLRGIPVSKVTDLRHKLTIVPGARKLCKILKALGLTLVVASGGFQDLANWLSSELGLDHAFANNLAFDPATDELTGELNEQFPIVDAERKKVILLELTEKLGINIEQTMAVGDGANDIPMLQAAGLGVAWKAKSRVQMEAPARLNVAQSLEDLVYLLGVDEAAVKELLGDWTDE